MYAVFTDGSRQYRVSEGSVLNIDYREVAVGNLIELTHVLLYSNGTDLQIGRPALEGVRVLAEVVGTPSTKTYVQHFRRRKNYRRLKGHRQPFIQIRVKAVLMPGQEAPKPEVKAPEAAPAATN